MRLFILQRTCSHHPSGFLISSYLPSTNAICTGLSKGTPAGPLSPPRPVPPRFQAALETRQPKARARAVEEREQGGSHTRGCWTSQLGTPEGIQRERTALGRGRPREWAAPGVGGPGWAGPGRLYRCARRRRRGRDAADAPPAEVRP